VGFVLQEEVYGSYMQYDAYPSGAGRSTVAALQEWRGAGMDSVRARVENMKFYAENDRMDDDGNDAYTVFRENQGDLAKMLAKGVMVRMDKDWGRESLFCEWGWLVNLDVNRLECYQGFQPADRPHRGMFGYVYGTETPEYGPVRLVADLRIASLQRLSDLQVGDLMGQLEGLPSDLNTPLYRVIQVGPEGSVALHL